MPDSTRAISSGAIRPVELFPGNLTMMYSTGPMVMCSSSSPSLGGTVRIVMARAFLIRIG